jgi:hypothetical protein
LQWDLLEYFEIISGYSAIASKLAWPDLQSDSASYIQRWPYSCTIQAEKLMLKGWMLIQSGHSACQCFTVNSGIMNLYQVCGLFLLTIVDEGLLHRVWLRVRLAVLFLQVLILLLLLLHASELLHLLLQVIELATPLLLVDRRLRRLLPLL